MAMSIGRVTIASAPGLAQTGEIKAVLLEKQGLVPTASEHPLPPELLSRSEVYAVDPAGTAPLDNPIVCLARNIYWEARSEGKEGMQAVANVVMNRLSHPGFPDSICAIVKQGSKQGACEFSWWCDGESDQVVDLVLEKKAYRRAQEFARKALNRRLEDSTQGALYYHHWQINPYWSREYIRNVQVGQHVFYKPAAGKAR
jgi:spore germination cell wall hydrolase CwlJ-like protein